MDAFSFPSDTFVESTLFVFSRFTCFTCDALDPKMVNFLADLSQGFKITPDLHRVNLATAKHLTTVHDSGAHFEDSMLLDVCDPSETAAQMVLAWRMCKRFSTQSARFVVDE